jgi:hypothetical protein
VFWDERLSSFEAEDLLMRNKVKQREGVRGTVDKIRRQASSFKGYLDSGADGHEDGPWRDHRRTDHSGLGVGAHTVSFLKTEVKPRRTVFMEIEPVRSAWGISCTLEKVGVIKTPRRSWRLRC